MKIKSYYIVFYYTTLIIIINECVMLVGFCAYKFVILLKYISPIVKNIMLILLFLFFKLSIISAVSVELSLY